VGLLLQKRDSGNFVEEEQSTKKKEMKRLFFKVILLGDSGFVYSFLCSLFVMIASLLSAS